MRRPAQALPLFHTFSTVLLAAALAAGQEVVLTPDKVVEFASRSNTAVLAAGYDSETAQWAVTAAKAAYLPTLRARASYAHLGDAPTMAAPRLSIVGPLSATDSIVASFFSQHISSPGVIETAPQDAVDLGYTLSQPLFTSGRLLNSYRAARYGVESARLAHERAGQEVRLGALRLFWTYVQAQQSVKPLQERVAWLEQLVKDQVARVEAGVLIEEDMLRVKTQLSLARLGVLRAQNQVSDVGEQLLLFCNLPLSNRIVVDTTALDVLDEGVDPPQPQVDSVVARRSDVRSMETRVQGMAATRRALVAACLPVLAGAFNHDFKNAKPGDEVELDNLWNVGLALDWNLLEWSRTRSSVRSLDVAVSQLRLALDARKRAIRAEVEHACRAIAEAREAERLALESVDNAQRTLKSADLRSRQGVITSSDLLDSRQMLTQAQVELIAARIRKVVAIEEYRAAVGTP